ncbi:MAG TPA: FliA/WhiG family RNA polymerase sigma factor [Terriglobia bacterium]|nr:FliA/WhiG family RNA polymerase sigma factor [Terriglobia bacterium]
MGTQLVATRAPVEHGTGRTAFPARRGFRGARDYTNDPHSARQRFPRAESMPRRAHTTHDLPEQEPLIVQLLPLVRRMAFQMREHLPAHVAVDDLIGAGAIGLIDAVRKFDPRKHVKLESYARHRIRGAILDSLRSLDAASRDMRKKVRRAERVHRELEAKLGRSVGDDEMAAGLGMSLKRWYRTVNELQPAGVDWLRPMEAAEFRQPDDQSLPAEAGDSAFDRCYRSERIAILNRAMSCLAERDRRLLALYYEHDLTMKQVGEILGIDESRVSQIHSAVLLRLKTRVRSLLCQPPQGIPPAYVVAGIERQNTTLVGDAR